MSISRRPSRRTAVAIATAGVAGSLIAGFAGAGTALAAPAHPNGFSVVDSYSSVSGSINYAPGLRKALAHNVTGVLTATASGYSNAFNGPAAGNGSFTAILQGKATLASQNYSGTFTINWPAGTLNPSNGTLSVHSLGNHQYSVTGTVTSGADTGASLSFGYLTTSQKGTGTKAHPVTMQNFVNTSPLTLSRNFG
jgi:hypothetical protein